MAKITIRKINNEIISFSGMIWGFSGTWDADSLIDICHKNGITEKEVVSLAVESDRMEIPWGDQFGLFSNLSEVILTAQETLRLNCYNFSKSTVRSVTLNAKELWFNDGAFSDATTLEYVTCNGFILNGWHEGLTEMLFQNCSALKAVYGMYRGENIMAFVFTNCARLEKPLDFYVKHLGYCTFMGCASLRNIHLHNGLISLGYSCFKNCISLEDIYIPDTVTSLGTESFSGCQKLKTIHMPQNIAQIPSGTFTDCVELRKVFLSDDIIQIEDDAFKGCSSLCNLWFPEKLKSIGKNAFQGCVSLKKVFLHDSIMEIGEGAFADCGDLIIRGHSGSYAEEYAKENGLNFVVEK